jgi:hypothetical protein
MTHEDERQHHVWSGTNKEKDIAALVGSIVAAVPGLVNHDGSIAQLDGTGGLSPINRDQFRALLDKYVCGIRVVKNGSGWQYDRYSFDFPHKPNIQATNENPNPYAGWDSQPDFAAFDRIYKTDLVPMLPKVVT